MAGAVNRTFRSTGWTRGRPWAAAACRADFVVGAGVGDAGVQIAWQAQYAEVARGSPSPSPLPLLSLSSPLPLLSSPLLSFSSSHPPLI